MDFIVFLMIFIVFFNSFYCYHCFFNDFHIFFIGFIAFLLFFQWFSWVFIVFWANFEMVRNGLGQFWGVEMVWKFWASFEMVWDNFGAKSKWFGIIVGPSRNGLQMVQTISTSKNRPPPTKRTI